MKDSALFDEAVESLLLAAAARERNPNKREGAIVGIHQGRITGPCLSNLEAYLTRRKEVDWDVLRNCTGPKAAMMFEWRFWGTWYCEVLILIMKLGEGQKICLDVDQRAEHRLAKALYREMKGGPSGKSIRVRGRNGLCSRILPL